jgi:prepilin-type N-terminal cleavage/methylation domain-containing protein
MINSMRGFTLLETLVAVVILSMAIAGPLSIASKGLQIALVAKDQTTAYYLTQDAIEYARFARDTNRLQAPSGNWLVGSGGTSTDLSPCVSADGSALCYFDSLDLAPTRPTACSGSCPVLYYDPNNHYFTYNANAPTMPTAYTRSVSITTPSGGNNSEAAITVTVTWSDLPGVVHKVSAKEDIYNWH